MIKRLRSWLRRRRQERLRDYKAILAACDDPGAHKAYGPEVRRLERQLAGK